MGDYSIYINTGGTPKDLYATVEGIDKVKLSGNPAVSRRVHDKRMISTTRLILNGCHPDDQITAERAIWGAESVAAQAYSSIKSGRTPDAYMTWFGAYSSGRKKRVRNNFKAIKDNVPGFTYGCGCDASQERHSNADGLYTGKYAFLL